MPDQEFTSFPAEVVAFMAAYVQRNLGSLESESYRYAALEARLFWTDISDYKMLCACAVTVINPFCQQKAE